MEINLRQKVVSNSHQHANRWLSHWQCQLLHLQCLQWIKIKLGSYQPENRTVNYKRRKKAGSKQRIIQGRKEKKKIRVDRENNGK